jgi:hypothetical protein
MSPEGTGRIGSAPARGKRAGGKTAREPMRLGQRPGHPRRCCVSAGWPRAGRGSVRRGRQPSAPGGPGHGPGHWPDYGAGARPGGRQPVAPRGPRGALGPGRNRGAATIPACVPSAWRSMGVHTDRSACSGAAGFDAPPRRSAQEASRASPVPISPALRRPTELRAACPASPEVRVHAAPRRPRREGHVAEARGELGGSQRRPREAASGADGPLHETGRSMEPA